MDFKIQTIEYKNSKVSFCPSRGGIITSIEIKGKEILYFDEKTFFDPDKSVRGGIPILFPNAGELKENNLYPELKRHGFTRDMNWEFEVKENGFKETLIQTEETQKVYPYNFKLSFSTEIENDGSISLYQEVENTNAEEDLPISMGLHPYFRVDNNEKKNITFDFNGGEEVVKNFDVWANGGTLYLDNPKIKGDKHIKLKIPDLGEIIIDVDQEYKKIWFWSESGKDFVCVESMERGLNGLLDDPKILKPGEKFKAKLNINLVV